MRTRISLSFPYLVLAAGAALAQSPTGVDPSPVSTELVGPSYLLADFDGDRLEDVYLVDPAGGDRLFRNLGDGAFEDVTAQHGLAGITGSRTAVWLDFDRDGALDLYVAHAQGKSRLFQNTLGGYFVDVTEGAGLAHTGAELFAQALDYDGDRLPDLHLSTEHGDVLFHNLGQGSFERAHLPAGGVPAGEMARGSGPVAHAPDAPVEGAGSTGGPTLTAPGSPRAPGSPERVELGHGFPSPTPGSAVSGEESAFPSPFVIGHTCTQKIVDQLTGLCTIQASTTPTLGRLYPLSTSFNINPSGNIGIGTTAQTGKLDVMGGMHVDYGSANTGTTANALQLGNSSSSEAIGSKRNAGGNQFGLDFYTLGLNRMAITNSGRVGIGTTAPTNSLHVLSTQQIPFRIQSNHTGGTWLELDNTSTNADKWHLISTGSSLPEGPGKLVIRDDTAGVTSTTFDTNGNVGIGTGFPSERLSVVGAVSVDNGNANSGSVANALVFGSAATGEGIGSKRTAGGNQFGLDFYTQGSNRMRITNGGLVGIGRTPTTHALEVQGDACKTSGGATWLVCSDRRIKTEIETIENALDTIGALRLVEYRYTSAYLDANPGVEDKVYYNVIAQEYQDVFPDYVQARADDGILQVDTHPALMHAIAAIQELEEVVEGKDQRIAALEDRLTRMEDALAMLSAK